ncbi:FAD-binding oxidoreductase [Planomonospora sp. ID82291]|uniref:NAD(P)/FAD-dependent oxidoreductase n=1 Tax=Planomonospora sp. ID82291 TaxID=2738136 RepID=UPI0018C37157|nr:FAD-dependent oxidoreductase [Planomonospora sp. ID82291]MBG0817804.1 FAD-dependent oxidoreductase [Planomonospora sp. ID82291]
MHTTSPHPDAAASALSGAKHVPLWLDDPGRPAPRPALTGDAAADLVIVGAGFTGLWTAVRAKERDPGLDVLLLEGDRIAEHASGRNGGFCNASLTHGSANGRERWPEEYDTLHRLGMDNLDAIAETIARYGIDCDFTRGASLNVATREHQIAAFQPDLPGFLDQDAVRRLVDSPTYLAGRMDSDESVLVNPARLAWGLAAVAEDLGVRIAEHTPVERITDHQDAVVLHTPQGRVRARQVALATNVFTSLLGWRRYAVVPVYDYVLATEPLAPEQHRSIGWDRQFGISDTGNRFHYYRRTPDGRILWGGYDAVYHYGRSIRPEHEDREKTHTLLADQFFETFPQLKGVRFTHRWAGVIDTSTRFCAFYGLTRNDRVAYAAGFTGLGVTAARFAADVMLDLLSGEPTERTRLRMVRHQGVPFPPEPLAWIGIQITRWSMAREDRTGRRNLWLRLLDRLGLGFGS